MSDLKITGFTAAPPGWRVVWVASDGPPAMVTAPMAGWLTGTDSKTGETVVEAATHCPGLYYGEAPTAALVYPATVAEEWPGGVWKILGPGEPLPSEEEFQAEASRREAAYETAEARKLRRAQGGVA